MARSQLQLRSRRRPRPRRAGGGGPFLRPPSAFTLIELIVVISVIALLVSILLPLLAKARSQGRLALCQSNLRSQMQMVLAYAAENREGLPPRSLNWNRLEEDGQFHSSFWTLARFMALQNDQPFPQVGTFFPPTGAWRCPEIRPEEDIIHTTHLVLAHSAPNAWVYNFVAADDETGFKVVGADALPGWEPIIGSGWRHLALFSRPADLIGVGDALTFFFTFHGHIHATESVGGAWQIVTGTPADNRGSHPGGRWPTAFLDGHSAALPMTEDYWLNTSHNYQTPGGAAPTTLSDREVEKLVWYVGRR